MSPADLKRSIEYSYGRVRESIERDWTGRRLPVAHLDKSFLRLTAETLEDGQLLNETVQIENDGPVLSNNLESVPKSYEQRMDLEQLLQSRIFRCKYQNCIYKWLIYCS